MKTIEILTKSEVQSMILDGVEKVLKHCTEQNNRLLEKIYKLEEEIKCLRIEK